MFLNTQLFCIDFVVQASLGQSRLLVGTGRHFWDFRTKPYKRSKNPSSASTVWGKSHDLGLDQRQKKRNFWESWISRLVQVLVQANQGTGEHRQNFWESRTKPYNRSKNPSSASTVWGKTDVFEETQVPDWPIFQKHCKN